MSRRAQENLVGVIVLAVFVMLLVMTLSYGSRARLVPLPVSILGIIFALAQLVWQNLRSVDELRVNVLDVLGGRPAAAQQQATAAAPVAPSAERKQKFGGELSAFALILILLALVFTVGPLPTVFLFTAGYLGLTRHCSPLRAVAYGLICVAVLYGLFGFILGVQLNRGLLSGFLPDYVDF
jgi:hypothetical protein